MDCKKYFVVDILNDVGIIKHMNEQKRFVFIFAPHAAPQPRMKWVRYGTDKESVMLLAQSAARREYPHAHAFSILEG